jgi:chromosomal replication initiation ATPase DnaA
VRPSVAQVFKALAKRYGLNVEDLMKGKRGKDNEPRKVGMYLVKELCDLKLKEIAERFGTASYGAVGWACHGVLTDAGGRKVSRSRAQRAANLPTKRFDPFN